MDLCFNNITSQDHLNGSLVYNMQMDGRWSELKDTVHGEGAEPEPGGGVWKVAA